MGTEFPGVYRYSRAEARRLGEVQRHEDSFRRNVECARAIEQAVRAYFDEAGNTLQEGCAQSVLEQYGFKRVNFVLANSLKNFQESVCKHLVNGETYRWGRQTFVPDDGKYNRYFVADTAASLLEAFIHQTRQAYQALGLFGPEHCTGDTSEQDFNGKVLVLSPDTLREGCWNPRDQLWYCQGGAGSRPHAMGQAVFATCLSDGERTRWNRTDFTGVLDEQFLPDWAQEKLQELRRPKQEQSGPIMGGMS